MAFLRGHSTVGGKEVATVDMIKDLIASNESTDINSRISKYSGGINTVTDFNNLSLDKNKNGVYDIQIANKITNDPMIINKKDGILFNLSTDIGKMQLFSTQENGGQAEFYLNSGATGNNFQKIALQKDLDTKLSLSGGALTGKVTSNSNIETTANMVASQGFFNRGIQSGNDILANGSESNIKRIGFQRTEGGKDTSCFMYAQPTQFGFYDRKTNKEILYYSFSDQILRSSSPHIELNGGNRVWHQGNLNPNDYVAKNCKSINRQDLNNIIISGYYYGEGVVNKPANIGEWTFVEVVGNVDILQKIYDALSNKAFWRVRANNKWSAWHPLGGNSSYSKTIASNEWRDSDGDGAYEITISHYLALPNITSVILTDSNGYSMSTGFSTIDENRLIVYCGTNPAGKIVVNATN